LGSRFTVLQQSAVHGGALQASVPVMLVGEPVVAVLLGVVVLSTVTTVFAENALCYTRGGFDIRLEGTTDEVVVAVSDASPTLAVRRERPLGGCLAGLDIVSALCHRWGNTPTSTGKTAWARIGAHDAFAGITGLLEQVGHAAS
jgi:hypothetical protein